MMASGPLPDDGDKEPHARHVESSNRDHAAVQDSSSPSPNSSGDSREEHRGTAKRVVHVDGTVGYVDRKAIGGEREGMPKGYFRSPQFVGTMVAQCLASICAYLGWVLPANTLTLINQDLGNSPQITWAATIWTMGSSVGFLLVGRLSDLFGRKAMVVSTGALSLAGCVLGGTARGPAQLVAANGCSGLGAAGQLSFGIVVGELVPNRMRGPAVSLVFLSSLPFAVFGPVVARSLILAGEPERGDGDGSSWGGGWRWSYYMGAALNVTSLVLYLFLYHPPSFSQLHVGRTRLQQARELDWVGIFLFVVGCVLFLVGVSWGGSTYPWGSAQVLCPLLAGIAVVVVFFVWEAFFCRVQPLMPPRMFKNRGFDAIVAIATVASMVYYSFTVLWPTLLATVYRAPSVKVGWDSSVVGGGVLLGQVMAGLAISYVPRVKVQCVVAACLMTAFVTALVSLSADRWAATISLGLLACTAVGYLENISFPGVTLLWEPQDIGLTTGVLGSIRGLGGAVAQALYSSIYGGKLAGYLPELVAPAAAAAGVPAESIPALLRSVAAGEDLSSVPGMTPEAAQAVGRAVVEANVRAFRMVFYSTVPFSFVVVAAACFVPDVERFLTQNVARRLQNKEFGRDLEKEEAEASSNV